MHITVNRLSALRVLRAMRAPAGEGGAAGSPRRAADNGSAPLAGRNGGSSASVGGGSPAGKNGGPWLAAGKGPGPLAGLPRHDLAAPDPSPRKRWTPGLLPLDELALGEKPSSKAKLDVAVPAPEARVQGAFASSTVYSEGLPPESFVQVSEHVSIPCPELLFVEAARVMQPGPLVLLGYELCGTYARDPRDPRSGKPAYGVEPVTAVDSIRTYIASCSGVRGSRAALRALRHVRDNAWSPMEALVAALAVMSPAELGYGVGDVRLNARRANSEALAARGCKESRVPDIEFVDTHVGINYDGHEHLDLGSVAEAASQGGDAAAQMASVRSRYVDDLRRGRELAATGLVALPVTSEDLYEQGALDALMLEVADVLEALDGRDVSRLRQACTARQLTDSRQKLVWSLLPWGPGARYAREMAEAAQRLGTAEKVTTANVTFASDGTLTSIEMVPAPTAL